MSQIEFGFVLTISDSGLKSRPVYNFGSDGPETVPAPDNSK